MNPMLNLFEIIQNELKQAPYIDLATIGSVSTGEMQELKDWIKSKTQDLTLNQQERIQSEYFGVGPLGSLLDDPSVTEILINGKEDIWFEKGGALFENSDHFFSQLTYDNFIHRLCRDSGIHVTIDKPFADGYWKGYRVHIVGSPISNKGTVISLRYHPESPWTFDQLRANGWCDERQGVFIEEILCLRKNLLIVGSTGSGKTSVLNACLQMLPQNERVVIVEDVDEIKSPNSISTKMLTRSDPQNILSDIDQSALVKQCLRMRPDRIVMGEIRGIEAKDLLMALATGHSGSMGTLHGESARQALVRLEMMVQMGAPQWDIQSIRTLIWMSLQNVLVVKKDPEGQRRFEGLYEITSLDQGQFLMDQIC